MYTHQLRIRAWNSIFITLGLRPIEHANKTAIPGYIEPDFRIENTNIRLFKSITLHSRNTE